MKWLLMALFLVGGTVRSQDDYSALATQYEQQLSEKGANASLLYNLGNAYYRLGNYGEAIYAYERALVIEPRSPDIRANLGLARKASTAFDESSQSFNWLRFLQWLSYREWLVACAFVLFLLAAISIIRNFEFATRLPISLRGPTIGLLAFLLIAIAALIIRFPELNRAIVVTEGAAIRISPFATADTKANLKAGQSVSIQDRHDQFYRIKNGWVSVEEVQPLVDRE